MKTSPFFERGVLLLKQQLQQAKQTIVTKVKRPLLFTFYRYHIMRGSVGGLQKCLNVEIKTPHGRSIVTTIVNMIVAIIITCLQFLFSETEESN